MPINLTSLSSHKKQFQTPDMKVPVIFHTSDNLLPNEITFAQLNNLAKDQRLFHHIAALSDIHPKIGRKNPTGTVVASKNFLFPQVNDTAPNCGMRLLRTELDENNITLDQIDKIFQALVKTIPTKKYIGTKIPYDLAIEICKHGITPLLSHFETRTKNEIVNSYAGGNFFRNEEIKKRDIADVIPKLFIQMAKYRLGILGAAGNHFFDLMKITDIIDPAVADKFQLRKGQYIFLLHTGSGILGQYASYMYTPKMEEHRSQKIMLKIGTALFDSQMKKVYQHLYRKTQCYKQKDDFLAYNDDTLEGKMFIRAHRAAANFGFANRSVITHNLDKTLEGILGRQVKIDLLYDTPHIFIDRENHFGEDLWIHRNGAVRANGPKRMGWHPLFSQTGEPVFIPSSMSTPAYLGVGTDENESAFFSASHGTGRRRIPENGMVQNKSELFDKMNKKRVKLYNAKSKGVLLQDSAYYKDVEEVISGMAENKIVKVAAKMEPIAVLMY
jgi:tRNA-splicing ligase RtcB